MREIIPDSLWLLIDREIDSEVETIVQAKRSENDSEQGHHGSPSSSFRRARRVPVCENPKPLGIIIVSCH